jgi:alpha-D-ribose 1-methylphosphonate 5-triphosphate synthase subunit PhnG
VEGALRRLHQIGNLGGHGYESTEAERQKILTALFDALHEAKRRLENKQSEKSEFTL